VEAGKAAVGERKTVTTLVTLGFLEEKQDESHARFVRLTDKGRRLGRSLSAVFSEATEQVIRKQQQECGKQCQHALLRWDTRENQATIT
jgi:DNA-binding MarR family transcriptional regulator